MKKLVVLLIVLLFPALAFAAEISTGETINIEKEQKNPIIFGNVAKINSDVKGDLTIFSSEVLVNKSIEGSAYIFGGNIDVKSPSIGNRLVVMGGKVKVSGQVKGDLIALGGEVTIDSPSIIEGDIFAYGGSVVVSGQAKSNLNAGGSKVMLEGALIDKNADIKSDQISISDKSQINGKLSYWSKKQNVFPSDVVKGAVEFNQIRSSNSRYSYPVFSALVMLAFFTLIMVWILKEKATVLVSASYEKFGQTLLTGFLVAFLLPIAFIILMISYIGILFGIALLGLYIASWFFAYAYSALFFGSAVIKWLSKSNKLKVDWISALVGSVLIVLIGYVPVIGPLAVILLVLTGLGMVVKQLSMFANKK